MSAKSLKYVIRHQLFLVTYNILINALIQCRSIGHATSFDMVFRKLFPLPLILLMVDDIFLHITASKSSQLYAPPQT